MRGEGTLSKLQSDRFRLGLMILFFLGAILVSFRHYLIEGDHLWTGEGARVSWSMRLRGKICRYSIRFDENSEWAPAKFENLTFIQANTLDDPLFILQWAQQSVCKDHNEVFMKVPCRAIGRHPDLLIREDQNLCKAHYNVFFHNSWIYPEPGSEDEDFSLWFASKWGKDI